MDDQRRDLGVATCTHGHCSCPACLAERGERACPDCGAVIPGTWPRCWPCEQERQAAIWAIQRYWTC